MINGIPRLVLIAASLSTHLVGTPDASPPCDHYGGHRCNYPFVPAPPGRMPPCAKLGGTFCEKIEHYPVQLIRYLIERWGYDFNTILSDESRDEFQDRNPKPLPQFPPYHYHPPHGYSKVVPIYYPQTHAQLNYSLPAGYPDRRYSRAVENATMTMTGTRAKRQAVPGATQLCPVSFSFVMPRAALNSRGNWMYTVNLNEVDDRYTQLVRSETCVSTQCNGLCAIPSGYTATCQQQYVQKRLIALEGSGDRLYTDVFWFPHCCTCQIVPSNG